MAIVPESTDAFETNVTEVSGTNVYTITQHQREVIRRMNLSHDITYREHRTHDHWFDGRDRGIRITLSDDQ